MKKKILLFLFTICTLTVFGQKDTVIIDGKVFTLMISESGDTILTSKSDDVKTLLQIDSNDPKKQRHYQRFKYHAIVVFPYAAKIVNSYQVLEEASKNSSKRALKKQKKELFKAAEFDKQLKVLTIIQTKIFVKMVARKLKVSMYEVLEMVKGKSYAESKYKFYEKQGVDIKQGYNADDDPILEYVLSSMDI